MLREAVIEIEDRFLNACVFVQRSQRHQRASTLFNGLAEIFQHPNHFDDQSFVVGIAG